MYGHSRKVTFFAKIQIVPHLIQQTLLETFLGIQADYARKYFPDFLRKNEHFD